MYNYTIKRLSCIGIAWIMFAAGTFTGGIGGMVLGLLERDTIGILGGAFLALLCGVGLGLAGLIFTLVFNLLVPLTGGIDMHLEEKPSCQKDATPATKDTLS